MATSRFAELAGVKEELVKRACSVSMKAHKSSADKPYQVDKLRTSPEVVFAFSGFGSPADWFSGRPFGETSIGTSAVFCPRGEDKVATSLRNIGTGELATVNEAFLGRFESILANNTLQIQVEKVVAERKQVVFTGHSSGGATAILATIWFLENYLKQEKTITPLCLTFGSPLVGDFIFNHALARESWSKYFIHFVLRYDIMPRVLLAPVSSMEGQLPQILHLLNMTPAALLQEPLRRLSVEFYVTVMRNASCVASQTACKMMGNTNPLLETVASFIQLSPYRPSGTYVFCTGNGKLVVIKNPDAILQILFYSLQLSSEDECSEIAYCCLKDHWNYQSELQESLSMQKVEYLENLDGIPLTSGTASCDSRTTNMALNDLGLSARARLCLRAAGEVEKQKRSNQQRIEGKMKDIKDGLAKLVEYKATCEVSKVGYYDAFKISRDEKDFHANVRRLELAGIWDEIIEMLKRYELPDGFEGKKEWVDLGTSYRHIVEPLDIANYYRHSKNEDTGPYMVKGRPKRYRFTQKWREHARRMPTGSCSESCFWAEVEELCRAGSNEYEVIKGRLLILEKKLEEWIRDKQIGEEVLLEGSTFVKWWKTLPYRHRQESCIARLLSA